MHGERHEHSQGSEMTLPEIIKKAEQRWDAQKRIKLPDVELISAERMDEPLKGDRIPSSQWEINHFGVAG